MSGHHELEYPPAPPMGITEADLFHGYSGLAGGRRRVWPGVAVTSETIRAQLAAADESDVDDGAAIRDDVARTARP